jgi:hypothetical protein
MVEAQSRELHTSSTCGYVHKYFSMDMIQWLQPIVLKAACENNYTMHAQA